MIDIKDSVMAKNTMPREKIVKYQREIDRIIADIGYTTDAWKDRKGFAMELRGDLNEIYNKLCLVYHCHAPHEVK